MNQKDNQEYSEIAADKSAGYSGVTQLNFNLLIFIDENVAPHKSPHIKSDS